METLLSRLQNSHFFLLARSQRHKVPKVSESWIVAGFAYKEFGLTGRLKLLPRCQKLLDSYMYTHTVNLLWLNVSF